MVCSSLGVVTWWLALPVKYRCNITGLTAWWGKFPWTFHFLKFLVLEAACIICYVAATTEAAFRWCIVSSQPFSIIMFLATDHGESTICPCVPHCWHHLHYAKGEEFQREWLCPKVNDDVTGRQLDINFFPASLNRTEGRSLANTQFIWLDLRFLPSPQIFCSSLQSFFTFSVFYWISACL